MKLSDFDYNLPQELIAQRPVRPRDSSRLLVLGKKTGKVEHRRFFNLPEYLDENDVLIFNNSKVFPARLAGRKETGGQVETLLTRDLGAGIWRVMLKKIGKKDLGKEIIFDAELRATTKNFLGEGLWEIEFSLKGKKLKEKINQLGETPVPPYIKQKTDLATYQTIYAKRDGSAAAPTAGLHFTEELFAKLKNKGVALEFITLHVGPGTFLPVKTENIKEHKMHREWASLDKKTAEKLNQYKKEGKRIIAVGTTALRTLEAFAGKDGRLLAGTKEVDIFIYPGYKFKFIDILITNFHLPKSTLLMLCSALAGRENVLAAYREAVKENYRFFSFGDAMLIK